MMAEPTVASLVPPRTGPAATSAPSNAEILGDVFWLMMQSKMHRWWTLERIETTVIAAIAHGRCRLYKQDGIPIGYVSIATLSPEAEERVIRGGYPVMRPDDWISGDRVWIIDFIVPNGNIMAVRRKLWDDPLLFRRSIKAFRPNRAGKGRKVVRFGNYRRTRRVPWEPIVIGAEDDDSGGSGTMGRAREDGNGGREQR
jgi:cytolysin-activating lysine-acyltransferase